jgi:type IV pilus assembly protein PilO
MDLKNFDINDVDFNNMGSWPIAAKAITCVLVFGVVAWLGFHFFVSEQRKVLESIVRKEVDLKKEFETKQAKSANLDDYKRQMETIKSSFQTLLQQLPKSSELAELNDELSFAATRAGCSNVSIKFGPERKVEIYSEKPISLEVNGGYHQLANFVSFMSRLSRIVTLHDFEIKLTDRKVSSNPSETLLAMTATAKTYRSDSEEE